MKSLSAAAGRPVFAALWTALAVFIVVFALARPGGAQTGLFQPLSEDQLSGAARARQERALEHPSIMRSRPAAVDFDQLIRGADGDEVVMNLFDDFVVVGVRDSLSTNSVGHKLWSGHVKGMPDSYILMVIDGAEMSGSVHTPDGKYQIRTLDEGIFSIRQIDPGVFGPEKTRKPSPQSLNTPGRRVAPAGRDAGDRIDLLVLYTMTAENAAGSITTEISEFVGWVNTAFGNADVNTRAALAATARIDFSETGDPCQDLTNLMNISRVETWRDQTAADIVMMIVETSADDTSGCGNHLYDANLDFSAHAYAVVLRAAAGSSNFSFPHEIGHIMGADHDCNYSQGPVPYEYAHGYVSLNLDWRTIMAYPFDCNGCPREPLYSNPGVTYQGEAAGLSDVRQGCRADNHRVLNNTRTLVADYRQASTASTTNVGDPAGGTTSSSSSSSSSSSGGSSSSSSSSSSSGGSTGSSSGGGGGGCFVRMLQ